MRYSFIKQSQFVPQELQTRAYNINSAYFKDEFDCAKRTTLIHRTFKTHGFRHKNKALPKIFTLPASEHYQHSYAHLFARICTGNSLRKSALSYYKL